MTRRTYALLLQTSLLFSLSPIVASAGTDSCWRIVGIPKPNAAVIWGKFGYQIENNCWVPQQARYFDENLLPLPDIRFDKVRLIGERSFQLRLAAVYS